MGRGGHNFLSDYGGKYRPEQKRTQEESKCLKKSFACDEKFLEETLKKFLEGQKNRLRSASGC